MRKILLLAPVILLLQSFLYGQSPVIQWQKDLGSTHGDYTYSIEPTSDGGYIIGGVTEGKDGDVVGYHGNITIGDIWVIKMSASGTVQWQKCLGGPYMETGADIRQTPDGGYIVAGSSATVGCGFAGNHGGLDFWLVKLSPAGDIQWQQLLGGSGNDYATSISPTADGGYIIGGYTSSSDGQVTGFHSNGSYSFDWWVIKVDGSGNLIWQKTLGGTNDDICQSVQATSDGGCIAAGYTSSTDGDVVGNHGESDAWIVKFSNTGTVQWQKVLGGSRAEEANSIQLTDDGGYIFAAVSNSNDGDVSGNHQPIGPSSDFWVGKLDGNGALQWQKCYGGEFNEIPYYIQHTPDGGYVLIGSSESADGDLSCNAGLTDTWIIKIGNTGILQWSKSLGGSYYDQGMAIQPLPDGTFIAAASTCSVQVPGFHPNNTSIGTCDDYWIIKLSAPQAVPPAPIVTLSPASGSVCTGSPATFSANLLNTGVEPAYQWTRNGVTVGTNAPTYTASDFKNNDIVKVTVQSGAGVCDAPGAPASASVTVHINNTILEPTITISSPNSFLCSCAPASFNAKVTGGGSSPAYLWMVNGVAAGTNSASWLSNDLLPTDVVTCQYSDSSGCIAGAPLISNAISLNPGTSSPASVTITPPANPACAGAPIVYSANAVDAGTNPIYQWKVNGVNAGTDSSAFVSSTLADGDMITCTLTPDPLFPCASGGSVSSDPVVVKLSAPTDPTVNITTPSTRVCKNERVSFTAKVENAGTNPSYQWEVNGIVTGSAGPDFTAQNFADGDIVQCVITVDPTYTCALTSTSISNKVILQVINQPDPSVSITASPAAACAGSLISFNADIQNAGTGPSYQWLVNGTPAGGNAPVFGSNQLSDGSVITCQLVPGPGACILSPVISNPIVAIVWPLPQAGILPADTTILSEGQLTLHTLVSTDVVSWEWSPAQLLTDPLSLTPTTPPLTDSVHYQLTVETADGCKATAGAFVRIYRALRMPNAFTPNGDGLNDVFRVPPGISLELEELDIYNRYGEKVFSTRNAGQGWDGTIGGHPAEAGVYVYTITGKDIKGPVFSKGTVILVR